MAERSIIVDPLEEDMEGTDDLSHLDSEVNSPGSTEPQVPDKFRNKSVDEIIASYENLEKELGRKGNELGELRKLTDQIIQSGLTKAEPSEPEKELTDEDFLEQPLATVQRLIGDAMKPLKSEAETLKKDMSLDRLEKLHPNMRDLVNSETFQEWILASPVRENLWGHAANGNFDFANELFTLYKDTHREPEGEDGIPEHRTQVPIDRQKLEDATAISRGTSRESIGGSSKVYRRSDLIRLKMDDPSRYAALQPEILQAYAEGRVK